MSDADFEQLIKRGSDFSENKDYPPIVELYMTNTNCTWLISELDPENPDLAFGLCDLGFGFPELGTVSLTELLEAQNHLSYLERDASFKGNFPLSVYARAANKAGHIVTDEKILKQLIPELKA